jgi:RNA polymerase sigma-70 factor, ECF subfamily
MTDFAREPLQTTDNELIAALQAGNAEALEPLLDRHLPNLRAFIALKAPVPHLVDETAHETFLFAYQHIGKFQPGTNFRAWLRAIASNLLRAEIQRYSRQEANLARLMDFQRTSHDASGAADSSEVDLLEECLAEAPDEYREMLASRYRDGRSSKEIAHRVQRSLAWVRTTLFRIRQQLRRCIEGKIANRKPC